MKVGPALVRPDGKMVGEWLLLLGIVAEHAPLVDA